MHISWHGNYTVRFQEKDFILVIDPHSGNAGFPPFRGKASVVSLTGPNVADMSYISGIQDLQVMIASPGEYSIHGTTVEAIGWHDDKGEEHSIQRWQISGMTVLCVGALNRVLTEDELAAVENTGVDILLLPVGGGSGLSSELSVRVVRQVEPRVVIPINFRASKLNTELDDVDVFASEMGVSSDVPRDKKVIIKPNILPQEDIETIVLNPS